MHISLMRNLAGTIAVLSLFIAGSAYGGSDSSRGNGYGHYKDACPVGVLPGSPGTSGTTLNDEFGPGTSDLTSCLSNRKKIKIVMQLNKSCRDSYATHPVDDDGLPTGDVSRVVNNIANCASNRAYALGNLRNMWKDLTITNGIAPENIDIKVVVHSGGGFVLLKDTGYDGNGNLVSGRNKFEGQVQELMDLGVSFYFCQNTTRSFMNNGTLPDISNPDMDLTYTGGATEQLIPGVQYVTAGVTAISDLQEQGYKYVQP